MDLDPARGADQTGAEALLRGARDHSIAQQDHPHGIVAAMAVGAAQPPVHPPVGQCARAAPRLVEPQPVHAVAPVADDQRAGADIAIGDIDDMAVKDVMRVIGDNHLPAVAARQPRRGRGKLTARGDTGGERKAQEKEPDHAPD